MASDVKIDILYKSFLSNQTVLLEDRDDTFEQNRLKNIEELAESFVDYYNVNASKPYKLHVVHTFFI